MSATSAFQDFIAHWRAEVTTTSVGPESGALNEQRFGALARQLFGLQFKRNEVYRRFCQARNATPESISEWQDIPALPTSAFKDLEVTSLPPEERTTVFHSSGTTAQRPSRHFHNGESLATYEQSLWLWFSAHLLSSGVSGGSSPGQDLSLLILSPPPAEAPHSSLVHMFECIRQRVGAGMTSFVSHNSEHGWTLDARRAVELLQHGTRPWMILGTAFSFVHLLDWMAEHSLELSLLPGSRVMETGGYKGISRALPKEELHRLILRRLGIQPSHIISEYGMSELSSQAYDAMVPDPVMCPTKPHRRVFRFAPWARALVVSPETGTAVAEGETGLLRIYDLANVFSVMAIQTEDLAIRWAKGFRLLGRAPLAEPRGCSLMNSPAPLVVSPK